MKYWKALLAVYQFLMAAFILYVFVSPLAAVHNVRWLKFFCLFLILMPIAVLCSCNAIRLLRRKPFLVKFSSLGILSYISTVLMSMLIFYIFLIERPMLRQRPSPWTKIKIGQTAPDFTLKDVSGNAITLSNFQGKLVLVDFWGVWCGPCTKSLPQVQNLFENFETKGLMVIAIHASLQSEKIASFLSTKGYTFTAGIDPGNISKDYGVLAIPTYFLINRSGVIIWGPAQSPPAEEYIQSVISDRAASDVNRTP